MPKEAYTVVLRAILSCRDPPPQMRQIKDLYHTSFLQKNWSFLMMESKVTTFLLRLTFSRKLAKMCHF